MNNSFKIFCLLLLIPFSSFAQNHTDSTVHKKIDLNFQLGYKTKGYTMGRTVEDNFIGWVGLKYNIHN